MTELPARRRSCSLGPWRNATPFQRRPAFVLKHTIGNGDAPYQSSHRSPRAPQHRLGPLVPLSRVRWAPFSSSHLISFGASLLLCLLSVPPLRSAALLKPPSIPKHTYFLMFCPLVAITSTSTWNPPSAAPSPSSRLRTPNLTWPPKAKAKLSLQCMISISSMRCWSISRIPTPKLLLK